jgi:hypothetical protein
VARDRRQALLVQTARPNAAEVGAQVADETEGAARRVLLGGFRRQMLEPRLWALAHRSAARRSSVRPHPMSVNAAISYSVARKRGSAWQRDGRPRGRLLTTSLEVQEGEELLRTRKRDLNSTTIAFIEESTKHAPEAERQAAGRFINALWQAIKEPIGAISVGLLLTGLVLFVPVFQEKCGVFGAIPQGENLFVEYLSHFECTKIHQGVDSGFLLLSLGLSFFGAFGLIKGYRRVLTRGRDNPPPLI